MPTESSHRPTPSPVRAAGLGGQAGFTIIEVIVAALLLVIVATGSAVAFVNADGTSEIQRNRSAAEALAQQNESKLRGYTIGQLSNLHQTLSPVSIDGTNYTVQESATYVSDSTGTPSCTNPSADYLETTSSVSWAGEPSALPPVTVTGLITPTYGEIGSTAGALAVSVIDQNQNPVAGIAVSVSGPGSASGTTASNGCALFGDLPVGTYTVDVTPASGTYVDGATGATATPTSPDVSTAPVNAGTTAAQTDTVQLAAAGSATFAFTDLFPSGSGLYPSNPAPTATAPSVVLAAASLNTPSAIICSAQDTTGCPPVSNPDTNWGASAWTGGNFSAQNLYPYSYVAYPGICTGDYPPTFGGSTATAAITAGQNTGNIAMNVPAMVIRLWSGSGTAGAPGTPGSSPGSEVAVPSTGKLVVTDTGCSEHYVGGPAAGTIPTTDSVLPVTQSYVGTKDDGMLTYPGMPYGNYTVCYQSGTKDATVSSVTNKSTGEIINFYATSLATGTCAT